MNICILKQATITTKVVSYFCLVYRTEYELFNKHYLSIKNTNRPISGQSWGMSLVP